MKRTHNRINWIFPQHSGSLLLRLIFLLLLGGILTASCLTSINVNKAGRGEEKVLEVSGTLSQQQTEEIDLPVGALETLELFVASDVPGVEVALIDAQGNQVGQATSSLRSGFLFQGIEGIPSATISSRRPDSGIWRIRLTSKEDSGYFIAVTGLTSTVLQVDPQSKVFKTGEGLAFQAMLLEEGQILKGGRAIGEIRSGDQQTIQTVEFQQDELGVFYGQFAPLHTPVRPDLIVTVTNGFTQRLAKIPLVIFDPTAEIIGVQNESLDDLDQNGRAESLSIDVKVNVHEPGQFRLAGFLETQSGEVITANEYNSAIEAVLNQTGAMMEPGEHTIRLAFSGEQIKAKGVAGPYQIRLILYDTGQAGAQVDDLEQPYRTKPYDTNQFE